MDPKVASEINEGLIDLKLAVDDTNRTFTDILGSTAKKIKADFEKDSTDIAADIEGSTNKYETAAEKEQRQKAQQYSLYKRQLQRRGYNVQGVKEEITEIRELSDTQQKFLKQLDKTLSKERELLGALVEPSKKLRELAHQLNSLESILGKFQQNIYEMTGNSKLLTVAFTLGVAGITGVTKAFSEVTDALFRGERGASVNAKGITALADAASAAVLGIGAALIVLPFGKILKVVGAGLTLLGAAIQGTTKLIEMGADLNDKLYKSYNELSERGLTTAAGMEGLYQSLHKVGLTGAEIEKFNKLLGENSQNLALFGGTAANGVKRFETVANAIAAPASKLNKEFLLMGITSDAQREHIMKYMTEEERLGLSNRLSDEQQIIGAKKYIENLDKLSMLTGSNRKELEEARATVMANENLRAAIFEAEQDKTEAGKARLAELKRFYEAAAMLQAAGDVKGATGIAEYAAGRGITGQASATAFIQFGGRGGLIERAKKGGTSAELSEAAAAGYNRQMEMMADTRRFGGDVSGLMTGTFAQGQEFTSRMAEIQKEAAKRNMSVSQYLDADQEARKATKDKTTQLNAEVAQLQQKTAQTIDGAAHSMIDTANIIMAPAMKTFNESVELFKKATKTEGVGTAPSKSDELKIAEEKVQKAKIEREKAEKKAIEETKRARETNDKEARLAAHKAQREAEIARRREETERANAARTRGITGKGAEPTTPQAAAGGFSIENILVFGGQSGSKSNFDSLNDDLKNRVLAAAKEYNDATGKKIKINSAKRDSEDQQRVWDESVNAGRPGVSPTGMPIARPGTSKHERGMAIDIQNYSDTAAVAAMNRQRLFQTVKKDPVHFELANTGAMFEGPTEGYFVQLHGKEFVGNEKQLDSIKKLISTALDTGPTLPTANATEADSDFDDNSEAIVERFTEMLQTKADELLDKIRFGNKIDNDLLNYSQG